MVVSLFFFFCLFHPLHPASHFGKVTPLLNVRLEDVLDRKHLPPLGESFNFRKDIHPFIYFHNIGLKDFEVCRSDRQVIN